MKRFESWIFALVLPVLLVVTSACKPKAPSSSGPRPASVDRTVLPLAEPTYPAITELDVRKSKAPPLFQVMAPQGAPNVIVILLDNLGFGATKPFGSWLPGRRKPFHSFKRLCRPRLVRKKSE